MTKTEIRRMSREDVFALAGRANTDGNERLYNRCNRELLAGERSVYVDRAAWVCAMKAIGADNNYYYRIERR